VLFVNVPIGIVLALLAPRAFSETERHPRRFDLPGAITCTLGVASLVYGLSNAAASPNDAPPIPAPALSAGRRRTAGRAGHAAGRARAGHGPAQGVRLGRIEEEPWVSGWR
jgi:hypothetical protein